jgi:transposase
VWLKNPDNLTEKQKELFRSVSKENTKTAKVYQLKLTFQDIYRNVRGRFVAKGLIDRWIGWVVRCRISAVGRFVKMLRNHYDGVLEYFDSGLTSGVMEGINSRIQEVKRRAKGFRNTQNFLDMIYLVCGGLDIGLPT